jgi:hypothetical protein
MDQQEAHAVANRFLENKSLIELYDFVLIPALGLIEQDRHQGTLDDVRSNFFFLTIGELVAQLTDYRPKELPNGAAAAPEPFPRRSRLSDFAIVCISASDQADELTTQMLVQLMERSHHQTLLLSATSVSGEILDSLSNEPNTVIFISALPPFAFSQARAICQRVRFHLPHNRIVIGLWNTPEDPDQTPDLTIERFGNGKPTVIVNTLAKAVRQVTLWSQQPTRSPSIRM